jgi:hypothetical protein
MLGDDHVTSKDRRTSLAVVEAGRVCGVDGAVMDELPFDD